MVTFTLRHRLEDDLRSSLDVLQRAYRRLTGLKAWRRLVGGLGYVGQIRALEMPWGALNGWHPHCHALLFVAGALSEDAVLEFERAAFELWEAAVMAEGGRPLLVGRGLRVTRGAAGYVAKVQEHDGSGWLAGSELARFDLKRGRGSSLLPFELLDRDGEMYRALWLEYVAVTKGRRAIFWSKGLRELLCLDAELSDDEVIDQTETSDLVFVIDGEVYDEMRDVPKELVVALETAEGMVSDSGEGE